MNARTTHGKGDQVMNRTQQKRTKVLVPLDGSRFGEQAIGAVARFTGAPRRRGVPARTLVRSGDPAAEILGCAKAEGASLIAMSTHGRSGLRRTLFGSVAEAVVRRSPLPVLIVRATGA
jgi:nucleotide-binding universal stress UspA family protein